MIIFELDSMTQIKFKFLDHVNLKSREFFDPLSQGCDEENVQETCNRQLSGTKLVYFIADYCTQCTAVLMSTPSLRHQNNNLRVSQSVT